jgi:hypothetical protein
MARIVGRKATVTYEVISQDEETEELLQQIISETLSPIVNKDKDRLKALVKLPVQSKRKKSASVEPSEKYARENVETPELIPLGGEWAYSVALVSDEKSDKAVRIAKGKIRGGFYRDKTTKEMVLQPDDPRNPISLVNKINIKRLAEWDKLQAPVLKRLRAIEEARKEQP